MLFERNCDSRSDMFRMFFQAVALGTLAISTAALGEDSTWAARAATEIQKRKLEVAVVPASTIVAIVIPHYRRSHLGDLPTKILF